MERRFSKPPAFSRAEGPLNPTELLFFGLAAKRLAGGLENLLSITRADGSGIWGLAAKRFAGGLENLLSIACHSLSRVVRGKASMKEPGVALRISTPAASA